MFTQFLHRKNMDFLMLVLGCTYVSSQFTQRFKAGIFECCSRLDFPIFPNSWERWKIGIFKFCSIGITSKFFEIRKEIKNWDDWVLKWNLQMNNSEWKLKVFKSIFNPIRTANLDIFFNPVEWIIYRLRRVNSEISEDWMIMVMTNWLMLLAVSEKLSHNFFNLKGDSVWYSYWVMLTKSSLGKGPMLYFWFMGNL